MKRVVLLSIAAILVILISSFKTEEQRHSLVVKVDGLRNNVGVLQFTLYNKDGSVPDEKFKKYYKMKVGVINQNASTITFNNLPEGKYAVNILHDENKDGKIDKGWILPTEGIGFSNITKIGIGNKPNFKKASFELKANKTIQIKVIYM